MKKTILSVAAIAVLLSACTGKSGSVTLKGTDSTQLKLEKNKLAALNFDNSLSRGDLSEMFKDCAPDFIYHSNGEVKAVTNIDSVRSSIKFFLSSFPDLKGTELNAVAEGDSVIVTGTWSATFKKDFLGAKATHKSFSTPDADIFTFNKEGKITSFRSVQSVVSYLAQVGIIAPPKK